MNESETVPLPLASIPNAAQDAAAFWRNLNQSSPPLHHEPYEIPHYDQNESTVPEYLAGSGPVIAAGLYSNSPADIHTALDSLIAIEQAQGAMPENTDWSDQLATPGEYVELAASDELERIMESPDTLVSLKTLRFLCHRTVGGSDVAQDMLSRHIYKVITPSTSGDDKIKNTAKQLQNDLLDAMSHDRLDSIWLREAFLRGIAYRKTCKLVAAWAEVGKGEKQHQHWRRQNLATMLALEQREPGLSTAITDTFCIRNFARLTPDMLHDMYRARLNNPEQPYAKKLIAWSDYNFANCSPKRDWLIFRALQKLGFGYEIHEFGSKKDIAHATLQAEKRAASGGEITDLLIDTHGNRKGLGGSNDFEINARNVGILKPLEAFLRPTAHIILEGCSAAQLPRDGSSIAEHIQRTLDRTTIAAKIDSGFIPFVTRKGRLRPIFGPAHYTDSGLISAGAIGATYVGANMLAYYLTSRLLDHLPDVPPQVEVPLRITSGLGATVATLCVASVVYIAHSARVRVILPQTAEFSLKPDD